MKHDRFLAICLCFSSKPIFAGKITTCSFYVRQHFLGLSLMHGLYWRFWPYLPNYMTCHLQRKYTARAVYRQPRTVAVRAASCITSAPGLGEQILALTLLWLTFGGDLKRQKQITSNSRRHRGCMLCIHPVLRSPQPSITTFRAAMLQQYMEEQIIKHTAIHKCLFNFFQCGRMFSLPFLWHTLISTTRLNF